MADYRLTQSGDEVQSILDNAAMRSQVTQETERATGAENQLQQNINSNTQAIGTEEIRAKGRENELQQLIHQVNASLINYYLKTETYSANQIDQMLAAIKQFRYQVVDVLPTPSADTMGIIYLVPSAHAVSGNIKDEYITLTRDEGSGVIYYFEQIGETAIDLSNYYTKAQTNAEISAAINTALAVYSTTAEMNTAIAQAIATAIANYYTKAQTDSLVANFITASVNNLVNYYLKSETYTQAEVNALIAAVHQFTYQSVATLPTASADTMNKIYLVPSTNPQTKNVKDEYITIATTDQGTTTYSWEQIGSTTVDLSGYSTTEQMNAAIANAIATALANYYTKAQTMTSAEIESAISTALASYSTTTQMNTAITSAINSALASYSTTEQMNTAITTAIANYYTKAEVDALIANFITKSVNDLVNYYLKSDTYTKTEVQQLIDAVKQFTYVSVAELPTASADTMNKIYLVPSTNPETKNVKDEYITIAVTDQGTTTYSWEQIGSTTVDLSGYYTSQQTDAAISNALNTALASYSTTSQMTAAIATAIANYYTKAEVDALIANFITASVNNLVNYYLKSETYTQAEVNQLIAAVQQFTYQSVAELPTASADTMNKIYLVPSINPETKNVKDEYITIAVTDQGTTTYSWEQIGSTTVDLSGYYTSAQTDAAINTALAAYSTTTQMQSYVAGVVALYYTKTEVDALIANFITKSVNDLVNYYLKSDTYTKAEVQQLIDAVKQFTYVSVAELPTASADTMNKIYLVPSANPQTRNVKDEFITIAVTDQGTTTYSWEMIGSTDISLDNYYTKAQTDAAITAAINTALASYSTTSQMNSVISTAITTALASYYNKTEIDAQMAQKQAALTFDNTPTENSNNPVKSGGVYAANTTLYNTLHGEVQAVNARIDTLFNADYVGFSVRLSDTTKVMNMIGTAEQLAAFDDWVDNSPKPCEVKKDGTDFAYLTNTAGVASSTSWLTRADGTPSKYSTQDKNYLQMVELENVNISIETTGTQLRVMFNFSPVCPEGFHRMFAEPTKLVGRYDLTFNSDGSTLDCCNGTSQPSGTFSFDNLHSMLNATGTDLLGWTAWEIACLGWIQAMRFRTLDVPSSARGKGLQSGSEAAARGWVNGTTDSLTTPHGGVDQNGNGGYRFMYMENCTDGKQWLMGFGWHGNNGKGYFTRDDYKANAQALIPILECEVEHDYPTNLSETYAKNVSELGIATEGGGSASSGFFDGNWSNTSDDRILYAGGLSADGAVCGPFARNVSDDASYAYWYRRGRVALRKSEVSA